MGRFIYCCCIQQRKKFGGGDFFSSSSDTVLGNSVQLKGFNFFTHQDGWWIWVFLFLFLWVVYESLFSIIRNRRYFLCLKMQFCYLFFHWRNENHVLHVIWTLICKQFELRKQKYWGLCFLCLVLNFWYWRKRWKISKYIWKSQGRDWVNNSHSSPS